MTLNLNTRNLNTWCPGCGNFPILNSVNQVFTELIKEGIKKENLVLVSGIGCHGKIVDYLDLNSFYALHGRGIPVLTGIKLANDNLIPIGFFGDGDAYAEGIEHLIHAAKRNSNITVLVHNNGVFALTTGQVTPTSAKGQRDHTTPFGNPEEPLNMVSLMLEANATFVARTYAGNPEHMKKTIKEAIKHKGFSFVEILQPCVTYHNTFAEYSAKTYEVKGIDESKAKETGKIPLGIFRRVAKPVYEEVVRVIIKSTVM
jgi:2-oxoglutarate ferredoxin oxidoreductase subunit beta